MAASTLKRPKPTYAKDLFLLFAIPLSIAIIAAVIVYVPRLLANPTYDFVYAVCEDYKCRNNYVLDESGKIIEQPISQDDRPLYAPASAKLFYYDVSRDVSRQITYSEAQKYVLINASKSPDGYVLKHESTGGGLFFGRDYDESWYLQSGIRRAKLDLTTNTYYSDNVTVIGWLTHEN